MNYANRKVADTMDMTPEDIAKQRHHHDIVELLTDWSLGCNSPKTVPAPTNVLSPLGSISPGISPADSTTLSPFQAPNSLDAQPPSPLEILSPHDLTGLEDVDLDWDLIGADSIDMAPEDIAKQRHHHVIVELLRVWSLGCNSPKTVPAPKNVLSPLGSISPGISPADSTTLSPFQAPNSLDAQPPSPQGILSPDDLAGLEEVDLDCDLIGALVDPTDMPVMPLEGQRLDSVHSTPDLPCVGLQPSDSRALVFNGRTCHSAQKAPPPISQQAAFQAIAYSNMYSHAGGVGGLGNGQPE